MRRIKENPFTIIITTLIIMTFAAYLFRKEPVLSESENRYLAGRPKITLSALADGSFMEQFELYTKEQLPLRDGLIKLKAYVGQAQFKNENNGIVRGRDGYLFEKLVKTNDQLEKNRAAICNFAQDTDREIYTCIIPNSCEILKDKLPAGFPGISQEAVINELYDRLGKYENVHTVNMIDTLYEHRDEYIYYRTDHHWTTYGAYLGYLELCARMGLDPVDIEGLSDKKSEREGFFGTYYSKYKGAGIRPDTITYYDIPVEGFKAGDTEYPSMYDTDKLDTYDKYAMFMHGNEGISLIDTGLNDRDLIVFKDSYSNCMIPFFTYDYGRIAVVDLRYYNAPVSELLDTYPDADILLIYNFMHFNEDNHFYRLTS